MLNEMVHEEVLKFKDTYGDEWSLNGREMAYVYNTAYLHTSHALKVTEHSRDVVIGIIRDVFVSKVMSMAARTPTVSNKALLEFILANNDVGLYDHELIELTKRVTEDE